MESTLIPELRHQILRYAVMKKCQEEGWQEYSAEEFQALLVKYPAEMILRIDEYGNTQIFYP